MPGSGEIAALIRPGAVFAEDADQFAAALDALDGRWAGCARRSSWPAAGAAAATAGWPDLAATAPGPEVAAAYAAIGPDSLAKILFTSGSTGEPKGVLNTHGMLSANQLMMRHAWPFLADRAAGHRGLAAVEPHLRRQPRHQHDDHHRRHAVHRRRAARAGPVRPEPGQPGRGRADDLPQRAGGYAQLVPVLESDPEFARAVLLPAAPHAERGGRARRPACASG